MLKLVINCLLLILICQVSPLLAQMDQKNKTISVNCAPELQKCLKLIYQLPEARNLIAKVYKEGPISIQVANTDLLEEFGAFWDPDERSINIHFSPRTTDGSIIGSILFELHNADVSSKLIHLDNLAATGQIDKASYVESIERLEYENSLKASKIVKDGIKQGIFPADAHLHTYSSFEEHYYYQRFGGHSAWIAKTYDHLAPKGRTTHSRKAS